MTIPKEAIRAAVQEAARKAILPRFRQLTAAEVATKTGPQDIVTAADLESEALITEALAREWPGMALLGEEGVARDASLRERMGQETCVILDPVDGTWNFAAGLGLFAVLLAVVQEGRAVWGMNYDPLLGDWIEADAEGAFWVTAQGRRRLQTAPAKAASQLIGYVPHGLFAGAQRRASLLAGEGYARVTSLRCAAHEYRMLVSGQVDFMISGPVAHPWDHAAGVLAVQAAGGVARFLDGSDYTTARREGAILAASSPEVWAQVAKDFAALR
ncbi:inositol monophosphatase family protein [Stagnihabitans tardus]|uniref:Inositol monophosphatase n=1 Tax=Stagnihabitans tardus TaxID=2699202 RepID=A0AAE4YCK9_9RHOB|nr:inositol monophosphatase [Stagnihabitans tardus]NBZ88733.1 inositol monophosphatase [Stagnihabitans tardus]